MAILSVRRNGVSHFYHHDGLGSTVQLTDANQNVTDSYVYRAFGEEQAVTGTTPNPLRFVGNQNYYTDGKSGLVLLGVRVYDEKTGRFLSRDHYMDGANWFWYAQGNPISMIDPTGKFAAGTVCNKCSATSGFDFWVTYTGTGKEKYLVKGKPKGSVPKKTPVMCKLKAGECSDKSLGIPDADFIVFPYTSKPAYCVQIHAKPLPGGSAHADVTCTTGPPSPGTTGPPSPKCKVKCTKGIWAPLPTYIPKPGKWYDPDNPKIPVKAIDPTGPLPGSCVALKVTPPNGSATGECYVIDCPPGYKVPPGWTP